MEQDIKTNRPITDDEAVAQILCTHAGKVETLTYHLFEVYWRARAGGQTPSAALLTVNRIYLKSIAGWHEVLDSAGA